jgi:hypothetical protein
VNTEGVLSLWRGLSPPVISVLIQNSIVFGTYSLTCAVLRKKHDEKLSIAEVAFAGGFGGFVQSFVISPLELAKIRVQVRDLVLADGGLNTGEGRRDTNGDQRRGVTEEEGDERRTFQSVE